jgi:hypothetical protein
VVHPNPTPSFTTTAIERCEIFRKNLVTENSNLTVPATSATIKSPYGAGIELPGTYAMDVEENTITKNPTDGILAFEYPNPYPPTEKTIYFELAGNRFAKNTFAENGGAGGPYAGDIFMQGGIFAKGKSQSTIASGPARTPTRSRTRPTCRRRNWKARSAARTPRRRTRTSGSKGSTGSSTCRKFPKPKGNRRGSPPGGPGNDASPVRGRPGEPGVPDRRSGTVLARQAHAQEALTAPRLTKRRSMPPPGGGIDT